MENFPELRTSRLLLNVPKAPDIPHIVAKAGHPLIADNTMNIPHPYQEKDAIFWVNMIWENFTSKQGYTFAIRKQADEIFMGGVGIRLDVRHNRAILGYWLQVEEWGKGYMTEAAEAVLAFGFEEVGLHKIQSDHFVENPASGKVMQKCGMVLEGELKDHYKKRDRYRSVRQYRMTRTEYAARKS